MLRYIRPPLRQSPTIRNGFHGRRFTSTQTVKPPSQPNTRIQRINSRRTVCLPCDFITLLICSIVPRFLRPYTTPLLHAPVSHITSFLLLHELTAIIPLLTLAATFHYTNWLPPYISEGAWVKEGVEKFSRYFKRKGWFGVDSEVSESRDGVLLTKEGAGESGQAWNFSEGGLRIVLEVATAWAITKALLPARLVLSVWATPWFARICVLPVTRWTGRIFGKGTAAPGAAATTAVEARTISKNVESIAKTTGKTH
jgi:hypothetical protein